MMQQDMRISQNVTPVLIAKSNILFYAGIINKYAVKRGLHTFPIIDYLLQNRSAGTMQRFINSIEKSFNFNFQLFVKHYRYLLKTSKIFSQRYSNGLIKQESNYDNRLFQNKKSIENKNVFNGKNILYYHNIVQMTHLHTKRNFLNENSLKSQIFNNGAEVFYPTMKEGFSIVHRDMVIWNKDALLKKEKVTQQFGFEKEKVYTSSKQVNMKSENKNVALWNMTHHKTTDITQKSISKHHILQQSVLPFILLYTQHNLRKDIQVQKALKTTLWYQKNIEKTSQEMLYQREDKKQPTLMYAVDKSTQLSQEVSDQIKQITQTQTKEESFETQHITSEQISNQASHYDVKKLANKVYPMIIKRWQKEYERRGVFYG